MDNLIHLDTNDTDRNTTFWHGTITEYLDGILENGLNPKNTIRYDHVCLTSDWKQALFWARLHRKPGIILIRVDGAKLNSARCTVETGGIDNAPYGKNQPGRTKACLKTIADDWRAYHRATDAIGYLDPIPVQENMIIHKFSNLEFADFPQLIDEYETGVSPFSSQELQIAA